MPDSTTSTIDHIFDLVDSFADKADRVLNRKKYIEDKHRSRQAKIVGSEAASSAPSASTAVAKRPRFYIEEMIAAESGATIYVVTDGRAARTECNSLAFAQEILRALGGEL